MLDISELFYSIQGESTFSGLPCMFIRLQDCNLRCRYCDARYSYEESGSSEEIEDILSAVDSAACSLVEITGGEPLLQAEVYLLMEQLLDKKYTVLLETNGSISISEVPPDVHIIMDVKTPGSDMSAEFLPENLEMLAKRARSGSTDEIKFVITSADDYAWSKKILEVHQLHQFAAVLMSPASGLLEPAVLAQRILEDKLPVRLQIQLHTYLWPEADRGK